MEFPAVIQILRARYDCDSCNAPAGADCRTLISGEKTSPHEDRWGQWRRDGSPRTIADTVTPVTDKLPSPVTLDDLTEALTEEGWGSGFSESLAKRLIERIERKYS